MTVTIGFSTNIDGIVLCTGEISDIIVPEKKASLWEEDCIILKNMPPLVIIPVSKTAETGCALK